MRLNIIVMMKKQLFDTLAQAVWRNEEGTTLPENVDHVQLSSLTTPLARIRFSGLCMIERVKKSSHLPERRSLSPEHLEATILKFNEDWARGITLFETPQTENDTRTKEGIGDTVDMISNIIHGIKLELKKKER